MRVGIVGAGSIAFGTAAFLEQQGHRATLWSPSGERTKALAAGEALVANGSVEGTFHPAAAASAEALVADAEAIVIALPAYGHKDVLDAIAPYITPAQTVIISSHASFGALYLSRAARRSRRGRPDRRMGDDGRHRTPNEPDIGQCQHGAQEGRPRYRAGLAQRRWPCRLQDAVRRSFRRPRKA